MVRRKRKGTVSQKQRNDAKKQAELESQVLKQKEEQLQNAPLLSDEKVLDIILTCYCNDGFWKPSEELAECLDMEYMQLTLGKGAKKRLIYIWCSICVLSYLTVNLMEYSHGWKIYANNAKTWLFLQKDFMKSKKDLIISACEILSIDAESMRKNVLFTSDDEISKNADAENAKQEIKKEHGEEEEVDSEWETICMEEPPYSLYYRHRVTYETVWEKPKKVSEEEGNDAIATQQGDGTYGTKKGKIISRQERDVSQYRLTSLRHVVLPEVPISCRGKFCRGKNEASILCMGCIAAAATTNASWNWKKKDIEDSNGIRGLYLCDGCCDSIHMQPQYSDHVNAGHFRFRTCLGKFGFPKQIDA